MVVLREALGRGCLRKRSSAIISACGRCESKELRAAHQADMAPTKTRPRLVPLAQILISRLLEVSNRCRKDYLVEQQ